MKKISLLVPAFCGLLISLNIDAQIFTSVDINPGPNPSYPFGFTENNNKLYFTATDSVHGYELWVSDGTAGGTMMLKDINPGPVNSSINSFITYNGKLYFDADDGTHGEELWVTDGTEDGTEMVSDIWPGSSSAYPLHIVVFNNKLYFAASDDVHGNELWSSDGTGPGTVLVADIMPGAESSNPGQFSGIVEYNNSLYFNAADTIHGSELWVSDGTTNGTVLFDDIWPGANSSGAANVGNGKTGFIEFNNKLYFPAADSAHGNELWRTDGTLNGTTLVSDILPGPIGSQPASIGGFAIYNSKIYFDAGDSLRGDELWSSDGTFSGTSLVADILPGTGSSYPQSFTVFNNKLFFNAYTSIIASQLFSTDGTANGTIQRTNIYSSGPYGLIPTELIVFNNELYFDGDDSTMGYQFFRLNTQDSLSILAPPGDTITTNNQQFDESKLFIFNGSLAFGADFSDIGEELWFYGPGATGIEEASVRKDIQVYPNPFTEQINLNALQNNNGYHLTLTDLLGQEIEQYQVAGGATTIKLYLPPALAKGIYFLKLSTRSEAETLKIIKQ